MIGISGWKVYQMRGLRPEFVTWIWDHRRRQVKSKQHPFDRLKKIIAEKPELKNWGFLIEDMNPELSGVWMLYFVFTELKEFLTIFAIIIFIGTPLA